MKEQKKLELMEKLFALYFYLVLGLAAVVGTITVLKLNMPEPVPMSLEPTACFVVALLFLLMFPFMHYIERIAAMVEAINAMEEEKQKKEMMLKKEMNNEYNGIRTFSKYEKYSEEEMGKQC